jgi:hypothetical protein
VNQKLFQNAHTPVALLPAPPPAPPPPPPPPHDGEATPEDAAAAFKGPWCCNQNAMHGRLPRGWAGAEKNRCPLPCTVSTRPRAALETPTWLESAAARLCDANSRRRRHLVLQCPRKKSASRHDVSSHVAQLTGAWSARLRAAAGCIFQRALG